MDVIDNELDTSGNGVPNTSNNTQSEKSMVSADDDTYMARWCLWPYSQWYHHWYLSSPFFFEKQPKSIPES